MTSAADDYDFRWGDPCPGRIINYWQDGALHNAHDRQLASVLIQMHPFAAAAAAAIGRYLVATLRRNRDQIYQLLALGCGLPTWVSEAGRWARVVYVEHQDVPYIDTTRYLLGSFGRVHQLLTVDRLDVPMEMWHPVLWKTFRPSRPILVLLTGPFASVGYGRTTAGMIDALRDTLPDGSALVVALPAGDHLHVRLLQACVPQWTDPWRRDEVERLLARFGDIDAPGVMELMGQAAPDTTLVGRTETVAYAGIAYMTQGGNR
ncbi:SAM-dependent methyltransferase [Kibdelosporangium phytohabitans]|uniref:Methyltransferase n=1 Tax=Kibdelosporangium phytohabitans TaxID=860235 RepID=A0A0N9HSX5_9PSEU|nr:SAM-dependent methyltransferase [Kibdelosporangium phytohabitans]ALG06414.1 hypothetical protein AOZ06_05270 [Kibdelosporangium phytohabitans]MBE1467569.1 hypothetical protein [Kibdelosporangium phytohabitans]